MKSQEKNLPPKPGVYLFRDQKDRVIYVGKANNLKKRVASYFQRQNELVPNKKTMLAKIKKIEHIRVDNETEALLLEHNLIKKYCPRYNFALKDDKSYAYIVVTEEDFPRIFIDRKRKKQAPTSPKIDKIFGPYTSKEAAHTTLNTLRKIFPFRSCKNLPSKPCPHTKSFGVRACLFYHINLCPAPCIRKIDKENYQETIQEIKFFLKGKHKEIIRQTRKKMLEASRRQDYEKAAFLRNRIAALERVQLMSTRGIQKFLNNPLIREATLQDSEALKELARCLKFKKIPYRIEAYDISNIQGREATGSMIVFRNSKPAKDSYRRFKIKTIKQAHDVAMIQEVVRRRLAHREWPLPHLIIVDGGKAQLNAALAVLKEYNLKIPVRALAKRLEEIYFPNKRHPITLPPTSQSLMLIKHIRDEAHRFAVSYHRRLRGKEAIISRLDTIPGIGPKKKQRLLKKFGSLDRIKKVEIQDLEKILGKKLAGQIKRFL